MSLHQLLAMGGYGLYVLPAYLITLSVFALNLFSFVRERKQLKKIIRDMQ